MTKFLLNLIKLDPVSALELVPEGSETIKMGDDHYSQSLVSIQLTERQIESLLMLVDNVDSMLEAQGYDQVCGLEEEECDFDDMPKEIPINELTEDKQELAPDVDNWDHDVDTDKFSNVI